MKRRDLTSQRFGKLVALYPCKDEQHEHARPTYWVCRCDCGSVKCIWGQSLTRGSTHSCGCVKGGPKVIDIKGQRFGSVVALAFFGRNDGAMKSAWFCECDCGGCAFIEGSHLRRGYYKSCGVKCPFSASSEEKHGQCHADNRSGAWRSWQSMKQRCLNDNRERRDWKHYRGRGIKVCERWLDFENFYADMGDRPEGMSLDRIDVNGDYEPGNCKWSTAWEQAQNRRAA